LGFKRLVTTRADVPQAVFNHYKVSCRIRIGRGLGGKGVVLLMGHLPGFLVAELRNKWIARSTMVPNIRFTVK
jgi:hypothetical protein